MTYNWNYQGRLYTLPLTVYRSIYNYYSTSPKGLIVGQEESSLEKYLALLARDDSIRVLSGQLSDLAVANGLDENQKLELAVSFVQNIPYDTEKVKTDPGSPRYAYEVLFDGKGICSEKSFLMYDILRQMGYGAVIFSYPRENHMNVGVKVDRRYSTDHSGYSMIETTSPMKVGVTPNLDPSSRQAVGILPLPEPSRDGPGAISGRHLSSPAVYAKTSGKLYSGIIRMLESRREIADQQIHRRAKARS